MGTAKKFAKISSACHPLRDRVIPVFAGGPLMLDYCGQPTKGRLTVARAIEEFGRAHVLAAIDAGEIYPTRVVLAAAWVSGIDGKRPSGAHMIYPQPKGLIDPVQIAPTYWTAKMSITEMSDTDLLTANGIQIG